MSTLDDRDAELEKKLKKNPIDQNIAVLEKAARKQKRTNWALAISIIFDIALTFFAIHNNSETNKIAVQAETNHAALIARCENTNEARAKNRLIWGYILDQQPADPISEAQKLRIEQFRTLVNDTFKPDDCSKAVPKQ